MSKVAIELEDREDGRIGIEIKVTNFNEQSNAIGLGQTIETFVARMVEALPDAEDTEEQSRIIEPNPKLVMVK